jgi:hypothetical protein
MELWRRYLEQDAESEGNLEEQIIVGCYHAAEILGFISVELDREGSYRELIDRRIGLFAEGSVRAQEFPDRLLTGTFTIYNHVNTLGHQFSLGLASAEKLISSIDEQVKKKVEQTDPIERSAAALRAAFPILCLMTLILNKSGQATPAIRSIEERFAKGADQASTSSEQLLNALYRIVEIMQVLVSISDSALVDQVGEIAGRFQEEDRARGMQDKLRNGFCRLFELGHLLSNHLDERFS